MRSGCGNRLGWGLAALICLAWPGTAQAHGSVKGLEGVVGGLLHPLTTPSHVLLIVALGLGLGQRRPLEWRGAFVVFMVVLAGALLATMAFGESRPLTGWSLALTLVAAAFVAAEKAMPRGLRVVLFGGAAVVLGLDSGPGEGMRWTVLKTLLGTWLMVCLLIFDVAYYSALVGDRRWVRVGVRVLGSWLLAVAVLMLAFWWRGK